jgi:putative peptidoglycan lipid II flippase
LIPKVKEADFFVRRKFPMGWVRAWEQFAPGWAASRLALLTAGNLGVSFFLNWYLLSRLGASVTTDAVFAALLIPQMVVMVMISVMGKALIPHFSSMNQEDQQDSAWGLVQCSMVLFGLAAGILSLSGHRWMGVFFFGFSAKAQNLLVELFRILVWMIPLQAGFGVTQSLAYAQGRFFRAEISALGGSLLALLALVLLFPSMGVKGYAWAQVLRVAVSVGGLFGVLGVFRPVRFRKLLSRSLLQRIGILTGGGAISKLTFLVDRVLSSLAPAGGLSLFNVGQQAFNAGEIILQRSIANPSLARISRRLQEGDEETARSFYLRGFRQTLVLVCLSFVLLLVLGFPFLKFIFHRGRMEVGDVHLLWVLMLATGGQLLSPVLLAMANRFYAKGDAWTPTWIGALGLPLAVCLRILFFNSWGIVGIALATSLYYGLIFVVYLYLDYRRNSMRLGKSPASLVTQ